ERSAQRGSRKAIGPCLRLIEQQDVLLPHTAELGPEGLLDGVATIVDRAIDAVVEDSLVESLLVIEPASDGTRQTGLRRPYVDRSLLLSEGKGLSTGAEIGLLAVARVLSTSGAPIVMTTPPATDSSSSALSSFFSVLAGLGLDFFCLGMASPV